jgi:DNA mismatch endonuclease (patch repair protein)
MCGHQVIAHSSSSAFTPLLEEIQFTTDCGISPNRIFFVSPNGSSDKSGHRITKTKGSGMPLTRSAQMSRIQGRDTEPEKRLRSALWHKKLRYRKHYKTPSGRPDVVFVGAKVAVYIDGCFWHGCPEHYVRPRSNEEFWRNKLASNIERDRRQTLELEAAGWRVVRVLEHEIYENLHEVVSRIEDLVKDREATERDDWRVFKVDAVDDLQNLERRYLVKLRNPDQVHEIECPRCTTKWKRPATRPSRK